VILHSAALLAPWAASLFLLQVWALLSLSSIQTLFHSALGSHRFCTHICFILKSVNIILITVICNFSCPPIRYISSTSFTYQWNQQVAPVSKIIYPCKTLYGSWWWTERPSETVAYHLHHLHISETNKLHLFLKSFILVKHSTTPDDGRKDHPKHVQCFMRINKFEKQVHLVGFTIGIYYDAQTYECQMYHQH
jgi:hypothetical protein